MQKSEVKQSKNNADCTNPHIKSARYVKPSEEVETFKLVVLCKHNLKNIFFTDGLDWE